MHGRRQVLGDRHRVHEVLRLAGQAVEVVLRRRAGLAQDRHQPLPDAGPGEGVEIGLAGDDESRRDGSPPAVSSPRLAPLPPTEPVSPSRMSSNHRIGCMPRSFVGPLHRLSDRP